MSERLGRMVVRAFEVLIVVCLAVMGILVFGNVILRYAFNSGIAVSEELSRLLFVWLIFLGSVLASAQRIHIGFDTLLHKVGPGWRRALVTFNASLILIGCVVFIVGGWSQVQVNLGNSYPVLGISYAWLYAAALVFGVALIFPVCNNILSVFRGDREPLTLDLGQRIEGQIERIEERQAAAHTPPGDRPQ